MVTGQWEYVWAAYVLTAIGTLLVVGSSWHQMRRSERDADAFDARLRQDREGEGKGQ